MKNKKRFFILTLGCKINQYESESIRENWLDKGFIETYDPEDADIILINSCAVTHMAVHDTKKYARRFIRQNPKSEIIITGCAIPRFEKEINSIEGISLCVPQRKKGVLLHYPDINLNKLDKISDFSLEIKDYFRARPLIKVQDGCSHYCKYCIVPLTRGPSRSREVTLILDEIKRILEKGFNEIIISGINLREFKGFYKDKELDIWDLIYVISKYIALDFSHARIRISSLDPCLLHDKALNILKICSNIAPHLHISIQSASPKVLNNMGRGHYSPHDIEKFLHGLSKIWPVFGLGCDILTGFPGENDEDFNLTYKFCKNMPFTYGHVFKYSKRPGTPAAKFPEQVENRVKDKRSFMLRELFLEKKKRFINSLLGNKQLNIVVEDPKKRIGMCEYYIICKIKEQKNNAPLKKGELITGKPISVDFKSMNLIVL